jgi:hypothetical protein
MSGTYFNSYKASRDVAERTGKKISVFNSKALTGALGLIILRIARAIENGESYEEIISKVDDWIDKTIIRVSVTTMKYIVRSGRVSPLKSYIAQKLDLKPVITVNKEGKSELFGKSFTEKSGMKTVIKSIEKIIRKNNIWEYAITHANNPKTADWYASEIEKLTGKKPVFIEQASPVLVANTGPGVVCVSLLLE